MAIPDKRPLKVFLCHAHADREAVRALYARLKREGVDVWLDKEKLLPGADWEYEIRKAVRESDVVVVCLSKQFNQAGFRQKEVRIALDTAMEKPEGEIFIIPARLEECDSLESLSKWHWVDLFESNGFQLLMRALRIRAEKIGAELRQRKHGGAALPRPKIKAGTDAADEISRVKAEQDAIEKARLDAEELERQKTAKEQADRDAAVKAARDKAEQDAIEKARLDAEELAKQKVAREQADREAAVKSAREKAERDAIEKARLDAGEVERQKAAKEQADRDAAAKAARDKAEQGAIEKARLDAKELEKRKAVVRSAPPKKTRPNTAIIVAVIGLVGTLGAALISSPWLQGMFSRPPEPTATLVSTATQTRTPVPTHTPPPSKTPTEIVTPTATPYPTEITDAKGITMRLVPAGEFTMGSDSYDDEKPIHQVYLNAFYMDIYEVTNAAYKACVDANVCTPPQNTRSYTRPSYYGNSEFDDFPVIYVDWNQAKTYCEAWRGGSLPTEAQWEKAARGTDGRTYPWGEGIDSTRANYNQNVSDTTEVGSYESGKSSYGIYDLAGNVWEWVSSLYQPYPYSATDGREDLTASGSRVLRGGSWSDYDLNVRSAVRYGYSPGYFYLSVGFRCARSLP